MVDTGKICVDVHRFVAVRTQGKVSLNSDVDITTPTRFLERDPLLDLPKSTGRTDPTNGRFDDLYTSDGVRACRGWSWVL
jgi:hypothetical protein